MKKFLLYFFAIFAMQSCELLDQQGEELDSTPSEEITISSDFLSIALDSQAMEQEISFYTTANWSISTSEVGESKALSKWISVSPSSGAAGSATVKVSVKENIGEESRSANITITAGAASPQVLTITQEAFEPVLSLSQPDQSVSNVAGSFELSLTANVDWGTSGVPYWVTLDPASGDSDEVIEVEYTANSDPERRSATIRFVSNYDEEEFTITQAGFEPTLALDSYEQLLTIEEGEFEIALIANVAWKASDIPDWITLDLSEGKGSATIVASYEENVESEPRSAIIKFTTKYSEVELSVSQEAFEPTLALDITSQEVAVDEGSFEVVLTSNSAWEASDIPAWVELDAVEGEGDATIVVSYDANPDPELREATIKFTSDYGEAELTITQAPFEPTLELGSYEQLLTMEEGTFEISLTSNVEWEASGMPYWMTFDTENGEGDQVIVVTYIKNSSEESRTATVTFKSDYDEVELVVTQAAFEPVLKLDSYSQNLSLDAGEFGIVVESNVAWEVSDIPYWMSFDIVEGDGDAVIVVTYDENTTVETRTATITFTSDYGSVEYFVTQTAFDPVLKLDSYSQNLSLDAGEFGIVVESNVAWEVSGIPDWMSLSVESGDGDTTIVVYYDQNGSSEMRSAIITFSGVGYDVAAQLSITQQVSQLEDLEEEEL